MDLFVIFDLGRREIYRVDSSFLSFILGSPVLLYR